MKFLQTCSAAWPCIVLAKLYIGSLGKPPCGVKRKYQVSNCGVLSVVYRNVVYQTVVYQTMRCPMSRRFCETWDNRVHNIRIRDSDATRGTRSEGRERSR